MIAAVEAVMGRGDDAEPAQGDRAAGPPRDARHPTGERRRDLVNRALEAVRHRARSRRRRAQRRGLPPRPPYGPAFAPFTTGPPRRASPPASPARRDTPSARGRGPGRTNAPLRPSRAAARALEAGAGHDLVAAPVLEQDRSGARVARPRNGSIAPSSRSIAGLVDRRLLRRTQRQVSSRPRTGRMPGCADRRRRRSPRSRAALHPTMPILSSSTEERLQHVDGPSGGGDGRDGSLRLPAQQVRRRGRGDRARAAES